MIGKPFDFGKGGLTFDLPYFYNPSKGNLLLDLSFEQRFEEHPEVPDSRLNDYQKNRLYAQSDPESGMARVGAFAEAGKGPAEGIVNDSIALLTGFEFFNFTLSSRVNGEFLDVIYNLYPMQFRLQYSDDLRSDANWKEVTDVDVVYEGFKRVARIPLSTLPKQRYFRVFLDTPQK